MRGLRMDIIHPYSKIMGPTLEVQFTEVPAKNREDQAKRDIWAFGVHVHDPVNMDVWVHEFTEWALADLIERTIVWKKNINAIAHVMAACHTVSGREDYTLQQPEEFIKTLSERKYKCLVHHPRPQKRLDRYLVRQYGGKAE